MNDVDAPSSSPSPLSSTTSAPSSKPTPASTPRSTSRSDWAFPLHRAQSLQLVVALVALTAVTALVGWLLTDALAPNAVTDLDDDIAQRLAESRTPTRTDVAHWGARIADTEVKIAVTALLALGAITLWRRWHEALLIVSALILEATAFIVASFIVGRSRPDVPRLLDSPVDSSFPSGHVAAATVYSVVVVIVFRHTRSTIVRVAVVIVCATAPLIVGWARMYQGMHFLSDVVAGVLLGIASVAVCALIVPRPRDDSISPGDRGRLAAKQGGDDSSTPVATSARD